MCVVDLCVFGVVVVIVGVYGLELFGKLFEWVG